MDYSHKSSLTNFKLVRKIGYNPIPYLYFQSILASSAKYLRFVGKVSYFADEVNFVADVSCL